MAKQEKGTTGLSVWAGQVHDEFLRELRGKEGQKRYDEMARNSPIIGAMLYYHEMAVRKVSWNFANRADRKAEDERVDFLNYARDNMTQSWNEFISEALSFIKSGFSVFWVNYKRDDRNAVLWDNFSPRAQNTVQEWLLNYPGGKYYDVNKRNGEILGFVQSAPPTYASEELRMERLLHFRTRVERNNPEGISLLRNAWVPYYFAKNLQSIEAIGFERDLTGMPVVTMPQSANTNADDPNSDASKAAEMVRNVRVDEQGGIVLPSGWEFALLSGSGKGFADIGKAIERYETRMLMAMLSQFIMLGQQGVGSLALSKDSTSIAEMIVNATADIIAETFTKQELPRILKLNGYDPTDIVLEHSPAGDTDITMLADFIQKVKDVITWGPDDELWVRQAAGLPEKTAEEIETAMAEKEAKAQAERDAQMEQLRQRTQSQDMPRDNMPMRDDNRVSLSATDAPLDVRKRLKLEKQLREQIAATLAKHQKRVMKAAKEMKG